MELNNTIAKPLYKQLEDQLKEEIDIGKRKAGSRLPTENELSTTYNVSRVTVRKALAGLSELGYLDRKSGKGTFVAERKEVYDARAKELLTEFDEIVEELFFLSVKEKELVERMDNLAEGKVDQ